MDNDNDLQFGFGETPWIECFSSVRCKVFDLNFRCHEVSDEKGVCVPRTCYDGSCPHVGNLASGMISGTCSSSGSCKYERSVMIA